jgi:hypothetical protein
MVHSVRVDSAVSKLCSLYGRSSPCSADRRTGTLLAAMRLPASFQATSESSTASTVVTRPGVGDVETRPEPHLEHAPVQLFAAPLSLRHHHLRAAGHVDDPRKDPVAVPAHQCARLLAQTAAPGRAAPRHASSTAGGRQVTEGSRAALLSVRDGQQYSTAYLTRRRGRLMSHRSSTMSINEVSRQPFATTLVSGVRWWRLWGSQGSTSRCSDLVGGP